MDREPQPREFSEEIALAQRVARIFGYDGLIIDVREGTGWATIRGENSITLIVDPSMLQTQTMKDATGSELPAGTHGPKQYSVYGIAHELGHVDDFLQPESDLEKQKAMNPSEHFFWNVLDDGVINNRLRHIPLLNNLTDEIYKDILFPVDDYSRLPKHVQFMYGWLLRNVTPQREVTFSEEVTRALDSLESVDVAGRHYDMYRTLAHPDTDYGKRREIATEHILPIYESFLEEDRQNPPQQNQQSDQNRQSNATDESESSSGSGQGEPQKTQDQSGSGSGSQSGNDEREGNQPANWDDIYDSYSEASHCGHQAHHHEDKEDKSGADDDQNPHDAIKKAAGALREIKEEQAEKEARQQQQAEKGQTSPGAGSIAAELELSLEDAAAYQAVVEKYRSQIHEVAKVLQQLTVPSVEYTSPRYQRQADTSGLKLSPRDLFQVVIAHHSNVDPAIWKPVETISKKEGFSFNGLDIHLVVDSSGSMRGAKADSAAACSVMLMEGLASARRMVQRYNPRVPKPDVRLQVILFGSSAQIIAPLSQEADPKDKGVAFTTIRDAASGSTLVTDALQETINIGIANPKRTQLIYLITDGDFSDRSRAVQALKDAGMNYFLYQYILLSPGTTPITTQASHLSNPNEMPSHMNKQLRVLASRFLV